MDVTLFEIHMDGAQFGPASIGEAMKDDTTKGDATAQESRTGKAGKRRGITGRAMRRKGTNEAAKGEMAKGAPTDEGSSVVESDGTESDGRSRSVLRFVPVVVVLGIAAGYLVSRRFRGGEERMADPDAEPVEIEA